MSSDLAQTPLYDWHAGHGGRMVDFAGWSMPVQYRSIVEEHLATRRAVGVFDVSHMGRFRFQGAGAGSFLDRLLTRRVLDMTAGKVRYAMITNEQGGVLDDVLVYYLKPPGGPPFHALVVNAGNRQRIAAWIKAHLTDADDVSFEDQTARTAMIAVQGPRAVEIAQALVEVDLGAMDYYCGAITRIGPVEGVVSRTGYTGEDGCELIVPAEAAQSVWEKLMEQGAGRGITAAGLGARDTLRLEAGMPLYGHELTEQINPYQAGLQFAVNLQGRQFVGREALVKLKADEHQPRRVGLELSGRRVARQDFPVFSGGQMVGQVTSGTFSPTLQRPIAMGYVRPTAAEIGTELEVEIRGRREAARVVRLPFYARTK